jgi:hypothetical protein
MGVLKVECDLDEAVSKDLVCEMTPLSTGGANLTFGVTLLKPANQVWVSFVVDCLELGMPYCLVLVLYTNVQKGRQKCVQANCCDRQFGAV